MTRSECLSPTARGPSREPHLNRLPIHQNLLSEMRPLLCLASLLLCLGVAARPAEVSLLHSDPQDLVGAWRIDLRPTPDAAPRLQDFVVTAVDGDVITGTFYGSPVEMSQVNTDWGGVRFAFVTEDARARYVTVGRLAGGVLEGTTYSSERGLLQPWRSVGESAAPTQAEVALPAVRTQLLRIAEADHALLPLLQRSASDSTAQAKAEARRDSLYQAHATAIAPLLDAHGWLGRSRVGEDGAQAAFLIIQHADHDPALQKRALGLLAEAVARGEAEGKHLAYLTDRVRLAEGRLQLYGTQLDYDEAGCPFSKPSAHPERLAERRRALGLAPLAEYHAQAAAMLGRAARCAPQ